MENTKVTSDTLLHFIKSHPLMDAAANTYSKVDSDKIEPIYYKKDVIFTKLAVDIVDINGKQMYIVFVATCKLFFLNHFFGFFYFHFKLLILFFFQFLANCIKFCVGWTTPENHILVF